VSESSNKLCVFITMDTESEGFIIGRWNGSEYYDSDYCTKVHVDAYLGTDVAAAVAYFIVGCASVVTFIYKKMKSNVTGLSLAFYLCLILFLFCRTLWITFESLIDYYPYGNSSTVKENLHKLDLFNKVWNRVCFCLFLYVFQLLLFYWIDTIHTTVNANFAKQALSGSDDFGFITPLGRKLFHIATAFVVVCVLLLGIVRVGIKVKLDDWVSSEYDTSLYNATSDAEERLDKANNIIISIMFCIYGVFFLFYGTKLNCRVHKSGSGDMQGIWATEIFSISLFALFLLRCFMFFWGAADGCRFNGNVFETLTYYVPEIGSVILILLSLNSHMFNPSSSKSYEDIDDHFTDPLDREIEENEMMTAGTLA